MLYGTRHIVARILVLTVLGTQALAASPTGTAVTYQGQLKHLGMPLTETADFELTLWEKADTGSTSPLLDGWALEIHGGLFLLVCFGCVLITRAVQCSMKAFTMKQLQGEHGDNYVTKSWLERWRVAFRGFEDEKVADYWLGAVIGFAELASYPVLIVTANLTVIGGWLAIKTASGWKTWSDKPTTFNRFLILNLINLGFAFFLLARWVKVA